MKLETSRQDDTRLEFVLGQCLREIWRLWKGRVAIELLAGFVVSWRDDGR